MSGDGEDEARFGHLLQPIRDLARNWDIDIASSLEDYLEELDQLQISLDGGQTSLNFAEAALLIQGTACIYSRKVEYLHSLVFQVLEKLTTQQGKGKGKDKEGADGEGKGKDKDTQEEEDEWGAFGSGSEPLLLLDDVISEGKDIDLKDTHTRRGQNNSRARAEAGRGGRGADDFCRPPLLVMEDHGSSFKVASCTVHKSGALLMEDGLGRELDRHAQGHTHANTPGATTQARGSFSGGKTAATATANSNDDDDDFDGGHANDYDFGGGGDDGYDDDYGTDPATDHNGSTEAMVSSSTPTAPLAPVGTPMSIATASKTGRELRTRAAASNTQADDDEDEEEDDPWQLLDPHDPGNAPARPFRKGKPPRPPSLKAKAKASSKNKDTHTTWSSSVSLGLTGLTFPEFGELLKAMDKHRAKARAGNNPRSRGSKAHMAAVCAATTAHPAVAEARVAEELEGEGEEDDYNDAIMDDDDDGGHYEGGWGGGGDYDDDDDDDMREEDPMLMVDGMPHLSSMGMAMRDSIAPMSLEDAFTSAPRSYEELCRAHMESFMRGLEAYAHETQLTRRVADWQDKVEPLLDQQERRGPFDIHCYGDEIIDTLDTTHTHAHDKGKDIDADPTDTDQDEGASTRALPFKEMVQGKERYEICRLFLASLQLANNGNVQLVHEAGPEDAEGLRFKLQLLSSHRMHDKFGDHGHSITMDTH